MSGAGHIFDMINRQKNNDALKQSGRSRYKKFRYNVSKTIREKKVTQSTRKELSVKELEEIRKTIKLNLIRERWIAILNTMIVLIIIAILLTVLLIVL